MGFPLEQTDVKYKNDGIPSVFRDAASPMMYSSHSRKSSTSTSAGTRTYLQRGSNMSDKRKSDGRRTSIKESLAAILGRGDGGGEHDLPIPPQPPPHPPGRSHSGESLAARQASLFPTPRSKRKERKASSKSAHSRTTITASAHLGDPVVAALLGYDNNSPGSLTTTPTKHKSWGERIGSSLQRDKDKIPGSHCHKSPGSDITKRAVAPARCKSLEAKNQSLIFGASKSSRSERKADINVGVTTSQPPLTRTTSADPSRYSSSKSEHGVRSSYLVVDEEKTSAPSKPHQQVRRPIVIHHTTTDLPFYKKPDSFYGMEFEATKEKDTKKSPIKSKIPKAASERKTRRSGSRENSEDKDNNDDGDGGTVHRSPGTSNHRRSRKKQSSDTTESPGKSKSKKSPSGRSRGAWSSVSGDDNLATHTSASRSIASKMSTHSRSTSCTLPDELLMSEHGLEEDVEESLRKLIVEEDNNDEEEQEDRVSPLKKISSVQDIAATATATGLHDSWGVLEFDLEEEKKRPTLDRSDGKRKLRRQVPKRSKSAEGLTEMKKQGKKPRSKLKSKKKSTSQPVEQ